MRTKSMDKTLIVDSSRLYKGSADTHTSNQYNNNNNNNKGNLYSVIRS